MATDYMSEVRKFDNIQDYVKHKWDSHYQMYQERWRDFYNNICFYEGYQWQSWDAKLGGYSSSPIEDEATQRIYMTSNLIRPLADTRMAMILGERPIPEVVSNDKMSPEAIDRAEKETTILKALWEDLNMQSLLTYAVFWSVLCNRSFLKPYFDPGYGKKIKNPNYDPDVARIYQESGVEYEEKEFYNMGRINIAFLDSYSTVYDTVHKPWVNVQRYGWTLTHSVYSIDDLYSQYDKKKVDKIRPDPYKFVSTVEDQLLQLRDRAAYESRKKDIKENGSNRNVDVLEYYEAPNNTYPGGLHAITCDDVILYDSREADETFEKIPIIRIKDQVDDKKSLVSISRQKQKMYNIIYSKIIERTRLPVFFPVPQGVDIDSIMGKSYEMFNVDEEYRPAPPIQANLDLGDLIAVLNKIELDLEHLWGIHEITSRAAPPGKSSSGRQVFLLQQADVSRLSPTMTMLSESLSDLGEQILDLAKKHYKLPRTLNYRGEQGRMRAITFSEQDISNERKVSVQMTSEYKRNKQAYMEFFVQFLGVLKNLPQVAQILNDPVVIRGMISYFDEKFANTLIARNRDMAVQERENAELLAGESPKVRPWHKHPEHIDIMHDMFNSEEFMNLSEEEQNRIIQAHYIPHLNMLKQQMESRMQAQMGVAPGAPPQAQGQSQPGQGMFKQATGPATDIQAVDRAAEAQVQPQAGAYGAEVT